MATVKATNATTAFLTSSANMRVVKEVRLAKYNALIPEALDETHQRTDFIALGWKGQCIPSPPKAEIRSRPPSFELLSQTTQSRYVYENSGGGYTQHLKASLPRKCPQRMSEQCTG